MLNQSSVLYSVHKSLFLDDEATLIYMWVVFAGVCQAVSVFGISANIINIVCFAHQGFQDPINISLLGLAVSDMCSLISLSWFNICYTPAVCQADLPFDAIETAYLTAGVPHIAFSRVTSWITAIITLERCLCVTFPLQVKQLITSRRMTIIIISVFIFLLACEAPIFSVVRLCIKFVPSRNRTILGTVSAPERLQVETISYIVNNFFMPLVAFIVIISCTGLLVVNLQNQTKWRTQATNQTELRNQNVSKMVVMISALFISCFVPMAIFVLVVACEPDFNEGGKSEYVSVYIVGISFVLESINSSSNIFIYFSMSIKYRRTFRMIFSNNLKWPVN